MKSYLKRANVLNLTLTPYQTAAGQTFFRVSRGLEELADIEENEVSKWLSAQLAPRPRGLKQTFRKSLGVTG